MKMTRRALAALAVAPAILSTKADAQAPANAAGGLFQNAARQLADVKLPRTVEPASRFEASVPS